MIEKLLTIPLSKKVNVYGKFAGSARQPLFIIIHGLPGNMDESFYKEAVVWFVTHGFATFRFNLYDWQKGARQLISSTLKTHASDVDMIVRYFRQKGFKRIFAAGHSFGGPSLLLSKDQDFDAVSLWDPSYRISFTHKRYDFVGGKYIKEAEGYLIQWGVNPIIGEAMAKEADTLDWDSLTSRFHTPVQIIAAGNGVLVPGAKKYFETSNSPKELKIIPGATHYFDDKVGMRESLFKSSHSWFNKFL
jgi:pimeloyl-ACP methyl ester carboxylesterase